MLVLMRKKSSFRHVQETKQHKDRIVIAWKIEAIGFVVVCYIIPYSSRDLHRSHRFIIFMLLVLFGVNVFNFVYVLINVLAGF